MIEPAGQEATLLAQAMARDVTIEMNAATVAALAGRWTDAIRSLRAAAAVIERAAEGLEALTSDRSERIN